ncbi:MAG TPA: Eco57I restriction-modification methylase domain-containing protein [Candidatus Tectomicrobia bacterium]|nr:Eco57I restriction-modification methylase domain-containing protein [Candidatus Tectomicrobia bacterium]
MYALREGVSVREEVRPFLFADFETCPDVAGRVTLPRGHIRVITRRLRRRKQSTDAVHADAVLRLDRAVPVDSAILPRMRKLAKRLAEAIAPGRRPRFAASFTASVVAHYWNELQRSADGVVPLRPCPISVDRLTDPQLTALATFTGKTASRLDAVDAAYFIATIYATMLPRDVRARLGIYYTPPALASRLIDDATAAGVDWASCRVLDPACGGGAFLAPVAQWMLKHLSHLEPSALVAAVSARLKGFEIDPLAAWLSQVAVDAVVMPWCRASGRRVPPIIEVCDSLTREPGEERFDLVIGNPPYGRVTLSPTLRRRYRRSLYGHANLYGVFTDLALRWSAPDGIVAYVTPTSFLSGQYFRNLRAVLAQEAGPVTIDFIEQRQGVFDDVLQEALLATYARKPLGPPAVNFLDLIDENTLHVTHGGTFTVPLEPGMPWIIPRRPQAATLAASLRTMPARLADWGYSVSTGPLVWNRHKRQIRSRGSTGAFPLVWAEAVTADGRFVFRADRRNHRPFFHARAGDDWLIVRDACVLVQRTTAKEQSRRLIAAELPASFVARHGGVVVENHLNMLRPVAGVPAVSPAVVTAFLNSTAADMAFRCLNGSVAVSAYELEALPLPPIEHLSELASLVSAGADRQAIDEACARLYGLAIEAEPE